jgi:hypothetical protein
MFILFMFTNKITTSTRKHDYSLTILITFGDLP